MRFKECKLSFLAEVALCALSTYLLCSPGNALSQAPFYQGKTITIIQGREPGGTGDMRVRAVLPYLRKYIPGNPTIVTEFMPGAGGRKGRITFTVVSVLMA